MHRLGGVDRLKVIPKKLGNDSRTAYARFTVVEDNIRAVRLFDGQRFGGRTLHVKVCRVFQREYERLLRCDSPRREQQQREQQRQRDWVRDQPRPEQREQSRDGQQGTLTSAALVPSRGLGRGLIGSVPFETVFARSHSGPTEPGRVSLNIHLELSPGISWEALSRAVGLDYLEGAMLPVSPSSRRADRE